MLGIRQDSEVQSLAGRRAENPEAAEDPPQTAYCAVCLVAKPGAIENLHAHLCRGSFRAIYREPGQLGATGAGQAAARCATQVLGNLPARAVPLSGRGQCAPPFRPTEPDPVQETGPVGGSPTALIIRHAVRNFA